MVVVLGDFGRSPRMQYHALALAESEIEVDVVAYDGTPPLPALRSHPYVHLHLFAPPFPWRRSTYPRTLVLALMGLSVCKQSVQLLWRLGLRVPKPAFILVQNPPSIPTLLVGLITARMRAAKLVIDWHNFGHSMLALQLKQGHLVWRMARWYEHAIGRRGDNHLCVSEAMRSELAKRWGIPEAVVLYDYPASQFAPTQSHLRQDLLRRIGAGLDFIWDSDRRPALIVCPTSWTADEDFALLLEAAVKCDDMISHHDREGMAPFPHLLIVITGEGPLRDYYRREIAGLRTKKVHLQTLWLDPEDYPLMVGAADLGLCCHRSASGFDLPMKLADLIGAGAPVLALNYGACLAERLHDGENGLLFETADQLASQLYELFDGFPSGPRLNKLRDNVRRSPPVRWFEAWTMAAAPIFRAI